MNILLSFRDIQGYESMIHIVDGLKSVPAAQKYLNSYIIFLYAFALNRRKKDGDRERALGECIRALKTVRRLVVFYANCTLIHILERK